MEVKQQNTTEDKVRPIPERFDLKTLSTSLDIIDVRILKEFYYPEPTPYVFKYLYQKFIKYGWKEDRIRCRLQRLANMNLVEIVPKTKPLCILPIKEHEKQLRLFAMAMLGKFDLKK